MNESASENAPLTLFQFNSMFRASLKYTFPNAYWITAEINELRVASNGHCYMELVQKDEDSGSVVARSRANIWRSNYLIISAHFERATGQRLMVGMKVLLCVTISFHELYGLSLQVIDLDPNYTIGDLAKKRKQIIAQLEEDGIIDLNKELPLPRIIRNVAIISSPTAAGYGDFCKQIEQSGYDFHLHLFAATMQGEKVEQSIVDALDAILADATDWDVVVIIRGGGATTDLDGFDSYFLAANVAQFPLPVLTGIGHERDDTIIDRVAHLRLKTPTAVAAFLIESRKSEIEMLNKLKQRLLTSATERLHQEQMRTENASQLLVHKAARYLSNKKLDFEELSHRFNLQAERFVSRERESLRQITAWIEIHSRARIAKETNRLQTLPLRMEYAVGHSLQHYRHRQELLERSIKMAGPERILSLGFSITTKDGKTVRDASALTKGDVLITHFAKGQSESIVQ